MLCRSTLVAGNSWKMVRTATRQLCQQEKESEYDHEISLHTNPWHREEEPQSINSLKTT